MKIYFIFWLSDDIGDEAMQNPDLFEGDILGFEPGVSNKYILDSTTILIFITFFSIPIIFYILIFFYLFYVAY